MNKKKYVALLFLCGVTLVFFWKFIVHGLLPIPSDTIIGLYHPYRDYYSENYPNGIPFKNFLITDPVRQQYPWRQFGIEQMKRGELPGWNPYVFAGTPALANYQSAIFYPLNAVFLFFPFYLGWSLLVVLQPVLAALFMYFYLRKMQMTEYASVFGSMVYALGAFNVVWFSWNTLGHTALWLPLVLLLIEKIISVLRLPTIHYKSLILTGLLFILVQSIYIFAGHTQITFYVFSVSVLYLIARFVQILIESDKGKKNIIAKRIVAFFSLSWVVVFVITAIQTLPFIQFVLRSARSIDQGSQPEGWFIPFRHLIQYLAPDYFGNPATLNYWGVWNYAEMVGYTGVIPLIFIFASIFLIRRRMVLFFAGVGFLSLVFASENLIAKIPYMMHIPFLSTSQPTRLLFVAGFCFSVLSALGFDMFVRNKLTAKKFVNISSFVTLLYLLAWASVHLKLFSIDVDDLTVSRRNLVIPTVLAAAGILLMFFHLKLSPRYKIIAVYLLIIVTCADLLRFGWKFTPFTSKEYLYPVTQSLEYLQFQPGLFRIMSTDDRILPPNFSLIYRLHTIDGYDPLYLKKYGELASALVRNAPNITPFSFNRIITIRNPDHKIIDMMNVKYVLSLSDLNYTHLEKVYEEGVTKIYKNNRVLPRAFLVSSVLYADTDQEVINYLFDESIDLSKTAISKLPISLPSEKIEPGETVKIVRYSDNFVEMEVTTNTDRLVVFTDAYYPNWKAHIDGNETKIYEVNYAFRGVVAPKGSHRLVFKYYLL